MCYDSAYGTQCVKIQTELTESSNHTMQVCCSNTGSMPEWDGQRIQFQELHHWMHYWKWSSFILVFFLSKILTELFHRVFSPVTVLEPNMLFNDNCVDYFGDNCKWRTVPSIWHRNNFLSVSLIPIGWEPIMWVVLTRETDQNAFLLW